MYKGVLKKMITENGTPIQYFLKLENGFINLNQCLGKFLQLKHTGSQCLNCNLEKPIFRQGFCKSCFFEIPLTGEWVMRPELSKAHLEKEDRDLEFEKQLQLQPHVIYLALSSHLKVGVTRKNQLPTRWIDQGAHEALFLVELPNRYLAGVGEVTLKSVFSDKTNWRKMLQNEWELIDWITEQNKALDNLPNELKSYIQYTENHLVRLEFPVLNYPQKPKSLSFSRTPNYEGKLVGIKGQYLIFEDETVFNVRSNEGKKVEIGVSGLRGHFSGA